MDSVRASLDKAERQSGWHVRWYIFCLLHKGVFYLCIYLLNIDSCSHGWLKWKPGFEKHMMDVFFGSYCNTQWNMYYTSLFQCVPLPAFWHPQNARLNEWVDPMSPLWLGNQKNCWSGVVDFTSAIGTRYPDVFKHIFFETGSITSRRCCID